MSDHESLTSASHRRPSLTPQQPSDSSVSPVGRRSSRRYSSRRSSRLSARSASPDGTAGSPPPSASASHHLVPTLPTVSLLTSLAGASHYSGMAADEHGHESFRPTFADGEDRTKLDDVRQKILDDTLALFCGKPTLEIFQRHWRKDAVFEDPLCRCHGYREYAAQWFGLAKMLSKSTTVSHRVLASTSSPNRIVYSQTQEYVFRVLNRHKTVRSLVVIHLDQQDKITLLEDKWKGDDQPVKWGALFFRKLNAKTMPIFIKFPKFQSLPGTPAEPRSSGTTYPPQPHSV